MRETNHHNKLLSLASALRQGVSVLDGSMGVMLQRLGRSGNFDALCLSEPELIADIHRRYLEAGADIIETNTFNSNRLSQRAYGMEGLVGELNRAGARIARREVDRATAIDPTRPRFVAGSMGPTGVSASISADVEDPAARSVTFAELAEAYAEQAYALIEGGVDVLLVETAFDLLNAKAAVSGIAEANSRLNSEVPFILSMTVSEASGRLLSGHTPQAVLAAVAEFRPLALGFNCSAGPASLAAFAAELAEISPFPVIFYPNAGLPDELGRYSETPELFTAHIRPLLEAGKLNIVGGCCGTGPEHIKAIAEIAHRAEPHTPAAPDKVPWLASMEPFYADRGFINVGERCNVAGSRKFLRLIKERDYDAALAIARGQVEDGAMMLDINFDDGLLDSRAEMVHFLRLMSADPLTASVPWMVDSSDFGVIEAALQNIAGKAVVNSISLKYGEEEFLRRARIIKGYGAAVVVMLFDEKGQATSFERKIEIAARACKLLADKAGYAPQDIIIDPNVLTVATGMPEHDAYARDFIRAVEWIHTNLPGVKTSGGVSNLSFAFRGHNYLREAMHAVFLYHAIRAGLSMAIVNPATRVAYADIPPGLLELIEDVVLLRRPDAADRLIASAASFSDQNERNTPDSSGFQTEMSVEERLASALRTGDETTLRQDLEEAVAACGSANAVVEGPLMAGMEQVGRLFEQGKMFLPQVVKSARTMHRAVQILTPMLEAGRKGGAAKGKWLIATVKGDVHDIGKSIVKVVLECNGYEVTDLGVQVDAAAIVDAARCENPDFIGLSGLIAPSLDEMVTVAEALHDAGICTPLFVGGAATSDLHTALRIAPAYPDGVVVRVRDASQNPLVASRLTASPGRETADIKNAQNKLVADYRARQAEETESAKKPDFIGIDWHEREFVTPTYTGSRKLDAIGIDKVRPYINWTYFLNCWKVGPATPEAAALLDEANALLDTLTAEGAEMQAAVAFYPAWSDGEAIVADGVRIPTPRQRVREGRQRCLALCDFVAPQGCGDHIGCFAVTVGQWFRERIAMAEESGDAYATLLLKSLCDRLAEAASEYVHWFVRTLLWGYSPDEKGDFDAIRKGRYRGIRPAVGYPSLPDQRLMHTLAQLVDMDSVGITVTENGALSPASSVAGLYIADPEACYFTL